MVMNGFDTNFDRSNEVYAVNTVAFAYMDEPIQVKRGELVRIYLVNALEFDLVNSFHIHANFFDYYPTGTRLEPRDFTDTVDPGPGRARHPRAALPVRRASTCSTPTSPSSRNWAGWASSRWRTDGSGRPRRCGALPGWLTALLPVVLLGAAIGLFVALDAPGLDRVGVPQEELAVERTVLRPGEIELHLRNDGADPVRVEQAIVNDAFAAFTQTERGDRPARGRPR